MNEKEVIREVMKMRDWNQAKLAEKAGFRGQSNITGMLNNGKSGMRVDNLYKILRAMGCELIVRDTMGSKKEWEITI